jgi:hypothetical protein
MSKSLVYVGMDVHKDSITIAAETDDLRRCATSSQFLSYG